MTTQRPSLNRRGIYITFKKQRRQRFSVRTTNVLLVKTRSNWLGIPLPDFKFTQICYFDDTTEILPETTARWGLENPNYMLLVLCCMDANWIVLSQAVASRTPQTIPHTYLPLANVYAWLAILRHLSKQPWHHPTRLFQVGMNKQNIYSWTLMDTRRLPVVNLAGLDSFHATILLPMNV